MTSLSLSNPESVAAVLQDFDRLGRDQFLKRHGYGRSLEYYVLHKGRYYDSKAIAGVAYGYENPEHGHLSPREFSGGEATVKHVLMRLGFSVVKLHSQTTREVPDALVLVENEVTSGGEYDFWGDSTGVRFHFPNQYKNRVIPGTPFVYYRGVRRANGRRGPAEYFGRGVVGAVWPDPDQPSDTPKGSRRWYCAIEDYEPFERPVAAVADGKTFETVTGRGHWRTGVRPLSEARYLSILAAAEPSTPDKAPEPPATPHIEHVEPGELFLAPPSAPSGGARRKARSVRSKQIGDRGESLVYQWLYDQLDPVERDSLDWLAQRGETPGWDIEYIDGHGQRIAVEVKATTARFFANIEFTGNEWRAAQGLGDAYVLALVTSVESSQAQVGLLRNPAKSVETGEVTIEPVAFRLTVQPPKLEGQD